MGRVRVYVDGYNLDYGLRAKYGRRYHWLDLQQLAGKLLEPDQQLDRVRYFTARFRKPTPSRHRQDTYLQALSVYCSQVEVTEGRFQRKTLACSSCGKRRTTYEEKESDVNLAVAMVEDAAFDRYDTTILISADSDLCPAVRTVKRVRPDTRVVAAFPPRRHSGELERAVDGFLWINRDKLRRSQLPDEVVTATGIKLARPAYWR